MSHFMSHSRTFLTLRYLFRGSRGVNLPVLHMMIEVEMGMKRAARDPVDPVVEGVEIEKERD